MNKQTKYIFITGGVVSSIGKGIIASSLGRLLKNRGLKIFMQKFDPYLNYDPSGMSPTQHGEVFVTADGGETDLDLGHYERFIDEELTRHSNITTGRVYRRVIEKERSGYYQGATVQVIPHVTNEIKNYMRKAAVESQADIVITEIGGTVGDIEGLPFLEAIRQMRRDVGFENTLYIHVTLVPYLASAKELKTKPTQHSVKELRSIGIQPDIIVLRSEVELSLDEKEKIALFCDVPSEAVIEANDVEIIYEIALRLHSQRLDDLVCDHFYLTTKNCELSEWEQLISQIRETSQKIRIALVGKYTILHDAYKSVVESLRHAGYEAKYRVSIKWIDSEALNTENIDSSLSDVCGIIVPGGFGQRGTDGMILACEYARVNKIPFLGICMGMQMMLVEFARNVCGITDATSIEFDSNAANPIITYLPGQSESVGVAGTLRIGANPCSLVASSKIAKLYGTTNIVERHRHRLEFNQEYRSIIESNGFEIVGVNPVNGLVEVIELADHPFMVGCQFHPEFSSRPNRPNPFFRGLVQAMIAKFNENK